MRYLLDSNLCIAIINKSASTLARTTLNREIAAGSEFYIPTIVVYELWYGVSKSDRFQANAQNLTAFLSKPFAALSFDEEDAQISGEIRAKLARKGTPIGPYDVLIAGQALARGLTLVTVNTREFSRVDDLKLVDWS